MNRLVTPSLRQTLFIDDGHVMNFRLGDSYNRIDLVQRQYEVPLIEYHWDQSETWQISAPQLSLLRCHEEDKVQFAKLFTLLKNEADIPAIEQINKGPSRIYLLMGGFDAMLMSETNLPISQFLTAMIIFCEQLHKVFPYATITWLGPGVWHPLVSYEPTARLMHESIYLLPQYKNYIQSFDITLDANSADFTGNTGFWTYPYLQRQTFKLRKLFTLSKSTVTNLQLLQESNMVQVPLFVKIPVYMQEQLEQVPMTAQNLERPTRRIAAVQPQINQLTPVPFSQHNRISQANLQISPLNLVITRPNPFPFVGRMTPVPRTIASPVYNVENRPRNYRRSSRSTNNNQSEGSDSN